MDGLVCVRKKARSGRWILQCKIRGLCCPSLKNWWTSVSITCSHVPDLTVSVLLKFDLLTILKSDPEFQKSRGASRNEFNSHHQQCVQALTKAVVWYSLYCNSMLADLRHCLRLGTNLEKRKAHGAIKRLSPETMQKIANGYLFLDWFAIPQNLGIFFRQLCEITITEWWKTWRVNAGASLSRILNPTWPGLRWFPHYWYWTNFPESWPGTAFFVFTKGTEFEQSFFLTSLRPQLLVTG